MVKPRELKMPKIETVDLKDVEPKTEIEVEPKTEVINTPMGSTTVDITPGKKVTVIGKDGVFMIIQKLSDGTISLSGDGSIIYAKPEEIRNVK